MLCTNRFEEFGNQERIKSIFFSAQVRFKETNVMYIVTCLTIDIFFIDPNRKRSNCT